MPGRRTRGVPGKRGLPSDFQFGPSYPWSWGPGPGAGPGSYESSYSSSSDSGESEILGLETGGMNQ